MDDLVLAEDGTFLGYKEVPWIEKELQRIQYWSDYREYIKIWPRLGVQF